MTTYSRPPIRQGVDKEGNYHAESTLTPSATPTQTVGVYPSLDTIPVIFVPGIMGTNLKTPVGKPILDAKGNMVVEGDSPVWRVDATGTVTKDWLFANAVTRQLKMRHDVLTVDDGGEILQLRDRQNEPTGVTQHARLDAAVARERGWGTVSKAFYGEFLDYLEHILNRAAKDGPNQEANTALKEWQQSWAQVPDAAGSAQHNLQPLTEAEIDCLLDVRNPVYAFGYNWLQSNADSGVELAAFIDKVITENSQGQLACSKVILLTHSMGGLVARHAVTVAGAKDKVAGVFHSVMPTDGAAGAYQRILTGVDGAEGLALGINGEQVTASLIMSPAGLQLLPNSRYNDGKPWLHIHDSDGVVRTLPANGDPYAEIYLNETQWWRLANQGWMDPANLAVGDAAKAQLLVDYKKSVLKAAKFHTKIQSAGDFHPNTHAMYGAGIETYETITWKLAPPRNQSTDPQDFQPTTIDVDTATDDTLVRKYPSPLLGSFKTVDLKQPQTGFEAVAVMQSADAPGDGTVPTSASAAAVDKGIHGGNIRVIENDAQFSHGDAYKYIHKSMRVAAPLHAITKIVAAEKP